MTDVKFDFRSKIVLVTGGGSGIGASIAEAFGEAGAKVAVLDIDLKAAEKVAATIMAHGGSSHPYQVDVADEEALKRVVELVEVEHGKLDVAVNNAGIEADLVPLADLSSTNWNRVNDVNLSAVFYGMKAQIPVMLRAGHGVILNTASISGLISGYNLAAYTATKHGVVGLTKGAAVDYAARGIRINALCPGLVDTPFIGALPKKLRDRLIFGVPKGRPGQPFEMAQAALWLCSDGASYVTGHAMVVDGGASLGATGTRFDDLEL